MAGLTNNAEPVRNVYPHSRDGELLLDVLLYDQNGRPLNVGSRNRDSDPLRRYQFTERGRAVRNSFPIRYVDQGTSEVKNPLAAPRQIRMPEITTLPLRVGPRKKKVRRP